MKQLRRVKSKSPLLKNYYYLTRSFQASISIYNTGMSFKDLRDFIQLLEQRSQLTRVTAPVSAELEITEITDRVSKGPAEKTTPWFLSM